MCGRIQYPWELTETRWKCLIGINRRVGLAASAYGRLGKIWNHRDIHLKVKLEPYRALELPVLLYASETWNLKKFDAKKIDSFDCRCLRRLLSVRWWQFVTNEKVWQIAESIPPSMAICTSRLRRYGHVNWMEKTRMPRRVYEAQSRNGRRTKGGQKKRWRDVILADIGRANGSLDGNDRQTAVPKASRLENFCKWCR